MLEVPKVLTLAAGTGRQPAPLQNSEIEALRSGLGERRTEPHPFLKVGQKARIRSDSLAGAEGGVVRLQSGLRVVITLDLVMKNIAVEIDGTDLELLAASPWFTRNLSERIQD